MNKFIGYGRWTRDTEVRYSAGGMAIASNTLAIDRGKDKNGEDRGTDFISCKSFDKIAEKMERYGNKGVKMLIEGHVQTGSYEKQDGTKVYTTDVIIDRWEFGEARGTDMAEHTAPAPQDNDGFSGISTDIDIEEELPFA